MSDPTAGQLQSLIDVPALAPPPGVVPNFVDPSNLHRTGAAVMIVTLVLSTIAILIRLYTTFYIIQSINLADYAIIIGWAIFMGLFAPGWLISEIAPRVNQWNVPLRNLGPFLYYIYIGSIIYGPCIFFIKLSILLQYLQIFVPAKRGNILYWIAHGLIWTHLVFCIICTSLQIFACNPITKAWDPLITTGHCIDIPTLDAAGATMNTILDIAILILPQISIWSLQMSRKRKIQVSAIFLIGIFACVCSITRLSYTVRCRSAADITYNIWLEGLWIYPELASGILVACLPVTPKFFQSFKDSRAFSIVRSSLRPLLHSKSTTTRRSTDNHLFDEPLSRHVKDSIKRNETLSDHRQLFESTSKDCMNVSLLGQHQRLGDAYSLHTVENDANV